MNSHHGFLAAVDRDLLAGDAQFPTALKLLAALRQVLDDPDASVSRVTTLVGAEPLVTTRMLRLANCVTFNPAGVQILTVEQAVQRVGFNMVRTAATAVAVGQMRALAGVPHFGAIADAAWQYSVRLSVLARRLAPVHAGVRADEAGLCGLVVELGTFYLLQRASRYPSYSDASCIEALQDLLAQHAAHTTARLAHALGLPVAILAVLDAWHQPREVLPLAGALYGCMQQAEALLAPVFDPPEGEQAALAGAWVPLSAAQAAGIADGARAALADLAGALGGQ